MCIVQRKARLGVLMVCFFGVVGCTEEDTPLPAEPAPTTPCDERMVLVVHGEERFCMDRYEARIEVQEGRVVALSADHERPTNAVSYERAETACEGAGYRLCRVNEWDLACGGPERRTFSFGNTFEEGRCNTALDASDVTGRSLAASGSHERCVTPEGIYDLTGNLGEWIDEADLTGTLRELRGGAYANYDRFSHCTPERHAFQPTDSSYDGQGFRCCADAR